MTRAHTIVLSDERVSYFDMSHINYSMMMFHGDFESFLKFESYLLIIFPSIKLLTVAKQLLNSKTRTVKFMNESLRFVS